MRNWTVDDCIDELRDITTSQCKTSAEELTRVTQLLNAISTYVKNNSSWNAPADFDLVVKFPAKLMGESQWSLEPLANVLIPDRRTQSRCFGSKLPWIDLEQAEIVRLKPLLNYLNERAATSHYISEVVQETTGYTGNTSRNETYETVLRGKVLLMLWYGTPPTWQCPCVAYHADLVKSICSSKKQKEGTSSLFRKLAVYGADKISIERSIQWQGTTIFADDEPGSMVLETSGDHVRVYFSTSDLQHRENILVSAVARMLCDVLDIYQEERIQACEMILQCQDHRKLVRKLEELGYDVSEALDLYEDLPEPAIEIAALPIRSREQEMAGDCSTEGIDIPDAAHATLESSLATMSLSETVPTTALPSNGKAEHVVESHETIPTPSTTAADLGNEPTTESNSSDTDRSVPVRAFAAAVVVPDSFDFAAMAASLSEDVARPSVQPLSRPFLPRADREAPSASTTNMEVASSRYQAVPRRTFGTSRSEQWKIDWQAGYKGELHVGIPGQILQCPLMFCRCTSCSAGTLSTPMPAGQVPCALMPNFLDSKNVKKTTLILRSMTRMARGPDMCWTQVMRLQEIGCGSLLGTMSK